MVVAVDIRGSQLYQEFIYQCFGKITAKHPQHTFIFISEKHFDSSFISSKNIIPEVVKPTKLPLISQLKISSLLKKYKTDVFVTGQLLSTNIQQCLIVLNKTTLRSLKRADVIVTDSICSGEQIIEKYNIRETTVDVVYYGVDEIFQPVESGKREKIKEQYADGHEYFLSAVTVKPDLVNLLKAFSVFKKMQKSSMQLLIPFNTSINKEASEALRLYKYKNEVKLLENISKEKQAEIIGAAYVFVYQFSQEYFRVFEAMRSGVPVITAQSDIMSEISGDAALYIDRNDYADIADKMMLIYKDENVRQQLIENGRKQVKNFSWDNAADLLWKSIEKAAN